MFQCKQLHSQLTLKTLLVIELVMGNLVNFDLLSRGSKPVSVRKLRSTSRSVARQTLTCETLARGWRKLNTCIYPSCCCRPVCKSLYSACQHNRELFKCHVSATPGGSPESACDGWCDGEEAGEPDKVMSPSTQV